MNTSSSNRVTGNALGGYLTLECARRENGTPFISRQDFRVPIHIGKGHVDEGALVLNLSNPTAGFFDGDRVDLDITVADGARLVLSTPAASRVYRTRSGKPAANFQNFTVGEGAFLEWIPEAFIPHADASYEQTTRILLAPSSSLLFFEWIAPGRVASGEAFAYQNLRWEMDLRIGGNLTARERFNLKPGDHSLSGLKAAFPKAHYLSLYASGEMTQHWPADAIDQLNSATTLIGHGPLGGGVFVLRALCEDSRSTRKLLHDLRLLLYSTAKMSPPALGRSIL
ncbi:MAG: urease accessory protein UreD [Akkermansiaceae bacterium]|nr:urease accessory protein UreD [Akkermansiaceae bacterium]